ncbi:unnamed protein product [Lactuca saligna]|uniref:Uncharacterized protein n=1 Tax=Lactuca saligna TaxID=75948 RepID=A0AA35VJ72_LACSI|nr:unnamed protein product [Lactuca saligna]
MARKRKDVGIGSNAQEPHEKFVLPRLLKLCRLIYSDDPMIDEVGSRIKLVSIHGYGGIIDEDKGCGKDVGRALLKKLKTDQRFEEVLSVIAKSRPEEPNGKKSTGEEHNSDPAFSLVKTT